LYFGTLNKKVIFGLPGNPGSALTCFYEYVLPAIKKMMNQKNSIRKIEAILQNDYLKNAGMTHFLKGYYENGKATILPSQASFQLSSFAIANCLIIVNEEKEMVKIGEEIEVHVFGKYLV
jgi:molybdopterin molybdotransferase